MNDTGKMQIPHHVVVPSSLYAHNWISRSKLLLATNEIPSVRQPSVEYSLEGAGDVVS
jgi:hypothetical protein